MKYKLSKEGRVKYLEFLGYTERMKSTQGVHLYKLEDKGKFLHPHTYNILDPLLLIRALTILEKDLCFDTKIEYHNDIEMYSFELRTNGIVYYNKHEERNVAILISIMEYLGILN